jgi:hypothetical protein
VPTPRRGLQPISNVVTPCAMAGTAHFVSRTTPWTLRTPLRNGHDNPRDCRSDTVSSEHANRN